MTNSMVEFMRSEKDQEMGFSDEEIDDTLRFYKKHGKLPMTYGTLCCFLALEKNGWIETEEVKEEEKQELIDEILNKRSFS